MKNLHRSLLLAGGLALGVVASAPPADAQIRVQFRFGTPDRPLVGRQYQNMRALAHYLDEEAWEASNEANETVAYSPRQARVLQSINEFAQRADSFHDRIDAYQTRPWNLPDEVVELDVMAQRVNRDIRRSRSWSPVYEQWNNVLVALQRMKQVLAGNEVVIPQPHRRWGDWQRDVGPFTSGYTPHVDRDRDDRREAGNYPGSVNHGYPNPNTYSGNTLNGGTLDEFRNLARQADQSMARALETANRYGGQRGDDGRLRSDLARLNDQVSNLWTNVDTEPVSAAQWSGTITQYLNEARTIDEGLDRTNAMSGVRPELQRTISLLSRMQQILSTGR
jgi:hypothetical protein